MTPQNGCVPSSTSSALRSIARCALALLGATAVLVSLIAAPRRNIIIFVADGLRPGSVNATDTPAIWLVRQDGVNFTNSHSLFPTLTMVNAAAIATGHFPGDTGEFANNVFPGFPIFDRGNFKKPVGTLVPSVEDDTILGDINDHLGGNYVREPSLLALARASGYNTAVVGKMGPSGMQDLGELAPFDGQFTTPQTILLDYGDADKAGAGAPGGVPVSGEVQNWLKAAGLSLPSPKRNQSAGTNTTPGTLQANVEPQRWLADAVTRALLPNFAKNGRPFVLVFWSGDPDQTQHTAGDSLNKLAPGVNGPTSKAGVRNADMALQKILEYLDANAAIKTNTDVFVTSDHGFSTVSRRDVDAQGTPTKAYSASFKYVDAAGRQEVSDGFLPRGALAIDLAHALDLPLFDPDAQVTNAGNARYQRVDPTRATAGSRQRPALGNGVIGGTGQIRTPDADLIVTSQTIYAPKHDRALVARTVQALAALDYVGGIFAHDRYGKLPGALPMSAIAHVGSALLPAPDIVISYRTFVLDPANPLMTSVMVGGVDQQHGQGSHGQLARSNTFNNMAALGPDFKQGFVDESPVGNADIQPTLAKLLGFNVPSAGSLRGRVLTEALRGGPSRVASHTRTIVSEPDNGRRTILNFQQVGREIYADDGCLVLQISDCKSQN